MKQTRRAYLASTSAIVVGTGLAGCLGTSSGGGSGASDTSHSCELTERDPVDELPQPTMGSDDAGITVDIFEDFACSHCADFATTDLVRLEEEYAGDDVRFRRFDLLVVNSDWNEPVANAARSVQDELGDEAFFEFALAAYENQSNYSWQVIGDLAEEVDADPCDVLSDASSGTYDAVIQADRNAAESRLDRLRTPSILVEGELIVPEDDDDGFYEQTASEIDSYL